MAKLREQVDEKDKALWLAKYDLAMTRYFRGKQYEVKEEFDDAIRAHTLASESLPSDATFYFIYERRGYCYWVTGQYNKSNADCEMVLKMNPKAVDAYNTLKRTISIPFAFYLVP